MWCRRANPGGDGLAHVGFVNATGPLIAGAHFGFVARQIDKLRIGSGTLALTAGPTEDSFAIPFTNDLRLLEVSR